MKSLYPRLLFLAVLAAALSSLPAFASDADEGPPNAIVGVRHDLPLLLADALAQYDVRPIAVIEWVVTDGRQAVAEWRAGSRRGVVVLRFQSGKWWWRGAASHDPAYGNTWSKMDAPGRDLGLCSGSHLGPPSAHDLLVQGFISGSLAARVSARLEPVPQTATTAISFCDSFGMYEGSVEGGYDAGFFHPRNELSWQFAFNGHGPTGWQLPTMPGSKLYYVFTMSTTTQAAVRFAAKSTLDVWFPFVLDSSRLYMLRINHVIPEIEVAPSSTRNNVLHFVLPPFEILEGNVAQGEIAGKD